MSRAWGGVPPLTENQRNLFVDFPYAAVFGALGAVILILGIRWKMAYEHEAYFTCCKVRYPAHP